MLDAQAGQRFGNQLVAGAVEGGIHHLEAVRHFGNGFLVIDLSHNVGKKLLVGFSSQHLNDSGPDSLLIIHALDIVEDVDFAKPFRNGVGMMGRQLGAVLPVDLIAVILFGIVAGGDVDPRLAAVLPDSEAQFGSGTQRLKNPHMNAVGGADFRRGSGKFHGVIPAVHADRHAPFFSFLPFGADHVGKALGGPADHVDVHVMQTGIHRAPQPGRSKLQGAVKAGFDFLGIVFDGRKLTPLRFAQGGAGQPFLIFFHEVHSDAPPFMNAVSISLIDFDNVRFLTVGKIIHAAQKHYKRILQ